MTTGEPMPTSAVQAASSISPRRLLILGCSKAKTAHDGLVPAIERYDGPPFRVLRRYLRLRRDGGLHAYVLSAEYGIIATKDPIPEYDRRMTRFRAKELRPQVADTLTRLLDESDILPDVPDHILVMLGSEYREALADYMGDASTWLLSRCVSGRPGQRLTRLKAWLYAGSPA